MPAKPKPKNLTQNMEQDIRDYMKNKNKLKEKIFEGDKTKSKPKINKNKKK